MSSVTKPKKVYPWERLLDQESRTATVKRSRNLENSAMNMNMNKNTNIKNASSAVRTTKRMRNNNVNNTTGESRTPPRTVKKPRINIPPLRTAAQGAAAAFNRRMLAEAAQKRANAAASARKRENEARAAASARRKAVEAARKRADSVKRKVEAERKAKENANRKAKEEANRKARENANRKARNNAAGVLANLARTRVRPANSRRNSVTNIGNGGNSMNNVNSDSLTIKKNGVDNKTAILLEIIDLSNKTSKMNNTDIQKLMNNKVHANSVREYHTYTWALLYDLVKKIDATKLVGVKISRKFLKAIHRKLITKNVYTSGRSKNGMGNRESFVIPIKDDDVVEFLFLIWLDGSHDLYIKESFSTFLNSKYCKTYFTGTHREMAKKFLKKFPDPKKVKNVPTFPGRNANRKSRMFKDFKIDTFKNVKGFNTIRNICIETESVWFFMHDFNPGTSKKMIGKVFKDPSSKFVALSGHFEAELKLGTEKILGIPQTIRNEIFRGKGVNNVSNGLKIVSIDQEGGGALISQIVRETDRFRPYVTAANLIDPGQKLLDISAGAGDRRILLSVMKRGESSIGDLDRLQSHYYVGPVNFSLVNGGNDFLKVKLSIRKGGPPMEPGRLPTLDFFEIMVNDKKIDQGSKKKNAVTPQSNMGKFMGDALQYMIVAIQNKYRGKERYFASGDGPACFMYAYFCTKIGVQPKLIIDTGAEEIRTVGV